MHTRLTAHVIRGKPVATKAIISPAGIQITEHPGVPPGITISSCEVKTKVKPTAADSIKASHRRVKENELKDHQAGFVTIRTPLGGKLSETRQAKVINRSTDPMPRKVRLGPVIQLPSVQIKVTKRRGRLVAKTKETLS